MEGIDIRTIITITGILISVAVSWGVTAYRVGRLEKDRDDDNKNIQSISIRLDEALQAGSVLESKIGTVEVILDPSRTHDFNKWLGGFEQKTETRLLHLEKDISKLDKLLIEHLLSMCEKKTE